MDIKKIKDWVETNKIQFEYISETAVTVKRLKDGKVFGRQFNDGTFIPYTVKADGIIQNIIVCGWITSFSKDKIHITLAQEASFSIEPQKEYSEGYAILTSQTIIPINDFEKEQERFKERLKEFLKSNSNFVNQRIREKRKKNDTQNKGLANTTK